MAKITFTKDFSYHKVGEVFKCSRDIARLAVGLGVAEITPEETEEVKTPVKKKKTK
jgi:hypothetical protein